MNTLRIKELFIIQKPEKMKYYVMSLLDGKSDWLIILGKIIKANLAWKLGHLLEGKSPILIISKGIFILKNDLSEFLVIMPIVC